MEDIDPLLSFRLFLHPKLSWTSYELSTCASLHLHCWCFSTHSNLVSVDRERRQAAILWCFNIFMFQFFFCIFNAIFRSQSDWSQVDAWGPSCLSTPWRTSRCWIVSIWGQTLSDAQKQMVPWIEGIETQESLEDCAACWFPFLSIAELCRHEGKVVQLELSPTQDTWMYTARILPVYCIITAHEQLMLSCRISEPGCVERKTTS